MKMIRKFGLLSLLLVAILFAQNASATLYLPDSSYAEAQNAWQGFSIYEEDGFNVRVDFAVYDKDYLQKSGEIAFVDTLDMDGQYIYAYQVFHNPNPQEDYEDVAYFGLLNIDKKPINAPLLDANSLDDNDGHSGIEPANITNTPTAWKWHEFDGGLLTKGQHSWFLVFSSNAAPVAGSYEIKASEPEPDFPVPEPGTLTLLGLGATAAFVRRRKSV